MIDPTLPECSPYLCREPRPLLTALRDVAEQRGIGLIEAERLVMPDKVVKLEDWRRG